MCEYALQQGVQARHGLLRHFFGENEQATPDLVALQLYLSDPILYPKQALTCCKEIRDQNDSYVSAAHAVF